MELGEVRHDERLVVTPLALTMFRIDKYDLRLVLYELEVDRPQSLFVRGAIVRSEDLVDDIALAYGADPVGLRIENRGARREDAVRWNGVLPDERE